MWLCCCVWQSRPRLVATVCLIRDLTINQSIKERAELLCVQLAELVCSTTRSIVLVFVRSVLLFSPLESFEGGQHDWCMLFWTCQCCYHTHARSDQLDICDRNFCERQWWCMSLGNWPDRSVLVVHCGSIMCRSVLFSWWCSRWLCWWLCWWCVWWWWLFVIVLHDCVWWVFNRSVHHSFHALYKSDGCLHVVGVDDWCVVL